MRPLGTPQGTPHPFAVPATTKAVWMPPAIIEDPDAPAVEEGEGAEKGSGAFLVDQVILIRYCRTKDVLDRGRIADASSSTC